MHKVESLQDGRMEVGMNKTSKRNRRIINCVLSVLAAIWFLPVVFAVLNMFKGQVEYNMGSFWALPEGNEFMANVSYIRVRTYRSKI